jgi:hypothetical protein
MEHSPEVVTLTRGTPCIGHTSSVPYIFFRGSSTNLPEDRGQREWGSGGSSPLVRGFIQFVNERNSNSDYVVTYVYSTELGIWPSFFKASEFRGGRGVEPPKPPPWVRQWDTQFLKVEVKI